MNIKDKVTYLESPATFAERQIAGIFEQMVLAVEKGNTAMLLSLLWDDVVISAGDDTVFTKKEYGEYAALLFPKLRKIFYRDVLIRVGNAKEASAHCESYLLEIGSNLPHRTERLFIFSRRQDQWRISRIAYYFPPSVAARLKVRPKS